MHISNNENYLLITGIFSETSSVHGYMVDALRCVICKTVVAEMEEIISKVKPTLVTNIGSHRLDEKGNPMAKHIPLIQSEMFLTEAMEAACDRMQDYARGYDKKTRELRIVKMILKEKLNPEMSEINPISDADLNESLRYHCDDIIDEYEDSFLRIFAVKSPNAGYSVCVSETKICGPDSEQNSDL